METINEILSYLNPEKLITAGGALFVILSVFAETGLLFGLILPGDSLLFTAGLLAGTDIITMNIWALYISILAAGIAGNEVGYRFGKKTGNYFYTREQSFFLKKAHLDYAREFYQRYGGMAVIYAKFVPIARTIIPIIAGVLGMENKKFIRYNVIGSFLRVSLFVLGGYFLGTQYREEVELYFHYIIFGILFISTTPVLIGLIKRSFFAHNKKESEEMDIPEGLL